MNSLQSTYNHRMYQSTILSSYRMKCAHKREFALWNETNRSQVKWPNKYFTFVMINVTWPAFSVRNCAVPSPFSSVCPFLIRTYFSSLMFLDWFFRCWFVNISVHLFVICWCHSFRTHNEKVNPATQYCRLFAIVSIQVYHITNQ